MRLRNITEKGRMVAQSGIITAMCNRYSVDITPVMHVISQGCNIHAHDIPVAGQDSRLWEIYSAVCQCRVLSNLKRKHGLLFTRARVPRLA